MSPPGPAATRPDGVGALSARSAAGARTGTGAASVDGVTGAVLDLLRAEDGDAAARATARAVVEAVGIARCAVYLRDAEGPGYRGRAAHPGGALEEAVRSLQLGGPSDDVTRSIDAAGGPVVLRDLRLDGGTTTAAMRAWGVTALLAAPIAHGGETLGILIADHAGRPHPLDDEDRAAAAELAAAAAHVLARLRGAERRDAELRTEKRRARALAQTVRADERLWAVVAAGGGVSGLVAEGAALTGRSVVLYDVAGHRVAETTVGGDAVRLVEQGGGDVRRLLDGVASGDCLTVPGVLASDLRHRHLASPVDVGEARFGWVAIAERPMRFSVADDRVLRRLAAHVGLELTVQRRAAHASLDARATLARLLVRGLHDTAETTRCATLLGIDIDAPRVVAYVRDPAAAGPVDGDALAEALSGEGLPGVLVTKGPEGIAVMVEVPGDVPPLRAVADVRDALVRACRATGSRTIVAGLSARCRDPHDLPRAYHEARDTARCVLGAGTVGGRVLAADDLGAARLFVANTTGAALDRFVDDVLAPLAAEPELEADLLRTMQTLFDTGRNVRHTAVRLGIHENTVRYRLARIEGLIGLDVAADPQAQLSVQTALLVLRLRDHPALPPLGTALHPEEDRP